MPDSFDYSEPRSGQPKLAATPFITYGITAICIILTTIFLLRGQEPAGAGESVARAVLGSPEDIWTGHYSALVTSTVLHLSWPHLIFDMMYFVQLATVLECTVNVPTLVAFIGASAVVGSTAELAVSGQTGAGMSGVVYALFGLLWAGRGSRPTWSRVATRDVWNVMLGWAVLCVVATHFHWMRIANGAHFGGLLFGLAVGYLFFAPRRRPMWFVPLVALLAFCSLGLFWAPWIDGWTVHRGFALMQRGDTRGAERILELGDRFPGDRPGTRELLGEVYISALRRQLRAGDAAGASETTAKLRGLGSRLQADEGGKVLPPL